MRLIQIIIDGYKHLRNTCVDFNELPANSMFGGELPIRFFIGLNGSGKSAFLEAICFLFSRIAQNETPGFNFSLTYSIMRERNYLVKVKNNPDNHMLHIEFSADGQEQTETLDSFAEYRFLLPDSVITCASGNNSSFFDIIVRSPLASLQSDLFDAGKLGKSIRNEADRQMDVSRALAALRVIEETPQCMFIDDSSSVFALAAFLAIVPGAPGSSESREYAECRWEILSMLDSVPRPVSLSLTLDSKKLKELGESVYPYGAVFDAADAGDKPAKRAYAWNISRTYQDENPDADDSRGDRVLTFLFEEYPDTHESPYIKSLSQSYAGPIEFLSKLLLARNKGLIKEGHISFKLESVDSVLEETALSEGEYMLLVRLGLITMGRCGAYDNQCLFLLDEPDICLNEHWNIDFVSKIYRIYEKEKALHEIIIATHSSLILTDALPEQLYYFRPEDGGVRCYNIQASTFGGSRNEIMQKLFETRRSVGSYAYSKVEELLNRVNDIDTLEACLNIIGSGYLRMRLMDKIQYLRELRG